MIGDDFTNVKVKNIIIGWNSADKLRGYRFPSVKESDYVETGVQANFETYKINPVTNQKEKNGNAHLNIIGN
ncbi:hypothetical protein ACWA5Z_11100 [Testudinibacter sp. P80/BLE/0925]|uniref:hypothetical protein n=1 Tax=Testudinibacter sp. TW-1 TaxID=3417757 RepID=UPI003D35F9B6